MINERLKTRRKELGLTLEQVGKAIGVNKSTVLKYENGQIKDVSSDVLIPLARLLKCSELYLLGVVDDPRPIKIEYKDDDIWDKEVGTKEFSDDEIAQLMDFAKYLISKRGK